MAKHEFKVVVVGGGPTGLALANMLEQLKIDYVVLEAHGDITPRIGTGIFLSNSLRVLDQLGCLESFYAGADEVEDLSVTLDDARMFSPATAEHFRQRFAFPSFSRVSLSLIYPIVMATKLAAVTDSIFSMYCLTTSRTSQRCLSTEESPKLSKPIWALRSIPQMAKYSLGILPLALTVSTASSARR